MSENKVTKEEIRKSVDDMVLSFKLMIAATEHGEPGTGDLLVEVLVEELMKLHSAGANCGAVFCSGCCDEDTPCCAVESDPACDDTENHTCDESCDNDNESDLEVGCGLTFGSALGLAKMGRKISRKGWNGKGQFVFLADDLQFHTAADLSCLEGEVYVHGALVFCGTSGIQVGWLASQSDMLSEDWFVMD
jgi:hypothetical protein